MNIAISFTLYTFAILTFVKGFRIYKHNKENIHNKQYVLYSFAALFSSLWSLGYAILWVQSDPEVARFWRAIGMIGVFFLFVFTTEFLIQWLEGAKIFKMYVRIFAVLGVFLWPFVIGENSVSFYLNGKIGMTYQFTQNIWNTLYNVYCVVVGINFFLITF